jgi:hypothetical protein
LFLRSCGPISAPQKRPLHSRLFQQPPGDRFPDDWLAALIDARLDTSTLPDFAGLRVRFSPDPDTLPQVTVTLAPLSAYDSLAATSGKKAWA